ncbi:MAG TPA: hypothetical protein VKH81_04230 [Candidatus Angelobacter sp.]|nr:hypothetical protein [Candidatus Angelobacter sp.]
MFYFQQLLNQGLNGIDQTAMLPAVVGVGYTILVIGFLIGLYQAAMRGGDAQSLAVTGVKYLVAAIILANWSTVFREVNGSFNQIAQVIDNSSGAGDMFLSWSDQLRQQFSNNGFGTLLPAIDGSFAAVTTSLMILIAYLIYAMMVVLFAFFYVLYGCLLYVLGPLVLALLPMAGVGQLAKTFATNLMIWNAWGILYATFGSLITAIQFNRVDAVVNRGFLQGFFLGRSDTIILGIVSIFYALALGLIPFIAKKLISGDVGSTAASLVKAGATAAGAFVSAVAGFSAGAAAASGVGPVAGSAGAGSSTGTSALASSSAPPPQPSLAQTIRGGIMSAIQGTAPAEASSGDLATGQQAVAAGAGASGAGGPPRSSQSSGAFRPMGVTQTAAFHAARLAGGMVRGSGNKDSQAEENA